jgi:hypothetical protein
VPLSPEQAARNVAQAVVDTTTLPGGAQPYRGPLPEVLRNPFGGINGSQSNVVNAPYRVWAAPEPAIALRNFDFAPSGYPLVSDNGGTVSIPGYPGRAFAFGAQSFDGLPLNVAVAQLDVLVTDDGHGGSLIRGDGLASWTPPKPAAEYVPTDDHVATITTLSPSPTRVAHRVLVTDPARVATIAANFNRIRLQVIGTGSECGMNPDPMLYTAEPSGHRIASVAFSHDARSKPNLIVSAATCYEIGVRARGIDQPYLQEDGAFVESLKDALVAHA